MGFANPLAIRTRIPTEFSPANYTPEEVQGEGLNKLSAHLKGIDEALANAGSVSAYKHTQSSSSATWTITHNLDTEFVSVAVYDSDKSLMIPDSIVITSADVVTVTFTDSYTGTALILGA